MLKKFFARFFGNKDKEISRVLADAERALLAGNVEAAMAHARVGAQSLPKSAEIHLQLAAVMLHAALDLRIRAFHLKGAEAALTAFLSCCRTDDTRRKAAGQILDEVRADVKRWSQFASAGTISIDMSDLCRIRTNTAMQLFQLEKYSFAVPLCENGYRWDGAGHALLLKIECLKKLGDMAAVKQACEQAMRYSETDTAFYNLIGKTLMEDLKAASTAQECFDKGLAISPNDVPCLVNRGVCRFYLGNRAGGRADLERALKYADSKNREQITLMLGQLDRISTGR